MSHTFTIYIFNSGNIFIRILVSLIPSRPGCFLTDELLLFLAGDVVPEPVRPDPDAVLVGVGVVGLARPEVTEGEGGAVSPAELSLVQEVCQTDPGPSCSSESVEIVLLLLGLHRGQTGSSPLTLQEGGEIVGWPGHHLHTDSSYVCVARGTPGDTSCRGTRAWK